MLTNGACPDMGEYKALCREISFCKEVIEQLKQIAIGEEDDD